MAINNRSQVTDEIVQGLRLNPSRDRVPSNVIENIQPVFVANEKHVVNIVRDVARTSAGTSAAYTGTSRKDFYLHGFFLDHIVSAATTAATISSVQITPFGDATARVIGEVNTQDTGTFSDQIIISFPTPIKLARGSSINLVTAGTIGAGTVRANLSVWCSEIEVE